MWGLIAILLLLTPPAQEPAAFTPDVHAAERRFADALQRHDRAAFEKLIAPDAVFFSPFHPVGPGGGRAGVDAVSLDERVDVRARTRQRLGPGGCAGRGRALLDHRQRAGPTGRQRGVSRRLETRPRGLDDSQFFGRRAPAATRLDRAGSPAARGRRRGLPVRHDAAAGTVRSRCARRISTCRRPAAWSARISPSKD